MTFITHVFMKISFKKNDEMIEIEIEKYKYFFC